MKSTSTLIGLALGAMAMSATPTFAQSGSQAFDFTFATFIGDGLVEQDVFVEKAKGSQEVYRLDASEAEAFNNAMLYATTEELPFQPFTAGGPYPMGEELGITLGEWLEAKGAGSYECDGNKATITATFENLIPNGIYTVWNFIDSEPPTDPWQGLLWSLGARDGSQNTFAADAQGNASYEVEVEPCLQLSGTQSLAGLAIAWHSDGKTYGLSPGPLTVVTHTQLAAIFPNPAEITTAGGQ